MIADQYTKDELDSKVLADLHTIAAELEIANFRRLRKEQLVDAILDVTGKFEQSSQSDERGSGGQDDIPEPIRADEFWESQPEAKEEPEPEEETCTGILDVRQDGYGLLRVDGYNDSKEDVYLSSSQIRRINLRRGDEVTGPVRRARRGEKYSALKRIALVNGKPAEEQDNTPRFEDLPAVTPSESIKAGRGSKVDIKKGSRILAEFATSAEAAAYQKELAQGLAGNSGCKVIALLVDVAPEVVTEWQSVEGVEAVVLPYDRTLKAQLQVSELVLERCKRQVERGNDVIFLVSTITEVSRTFGTDMVALHKAKRYFGAGRAIADGKGSLTIVAAALGASGVAADATLLQELRGIAHS